MAIRSAMNDAHVSQAEWDRIFKGVQPEGSKPDFEAELKEEDFESKIEKLKNFTVWKHRKSGNLYWVLENSVELHISNDELDGETLIVYADMNGANYARPMEEFLEKFDFFNEDWDVSDEILDKSALED